MSCPETVTATYRIVTPMFIGDAEQNASGITAASVKGALRFWWRALNWGRIRNGTQYDHIALKTLHEEEEKLFGSIGKTNGKEEQKGGQGQFILRVEQPENLDNLILDSSKLNNHDVYKLENSKWHSYLLGLGLMKYDRDKKKNFYIKYRSAIASSDFTIKLCCKNKETVEAIKPVLILWGMLGGLGSRNRRGLGSVSIQEIDGKNIISNRDDFIKELKKLLSCLCENEPPFTAFSEKTQFIISKQSSDKAWKVIGDIGEKMSLFRGWGYRSKDGTHKINNENANHNAYTSKQEDHKIIYDIAKKNNQENEYPKSLVFGLPRSYGLSGFSPKKDIKVEPSKTGNDDKHDDTNKRTRRASPLFIHVHEFADGNTLSIQSFLPATFLPKNDVIRFYEKKKEKEKEKWEKIQDIPPSGKTDWTVIKEYLATYSPDWEEIKL